MLESYHAVTFNYQTCLADGSGITPGPSKWNIQTRERKSILFRDLPLYLDISVFFVVSTVIYTQADRLAVRLADGRGGRQAGRHADSCNNKRSNNWNASLKENWPIRPRVGLVTNSRRYRLQILCFWSVFFKHCVGCSKPLRSNKRSAKAVLLSAKYPSPDWNGKCCIPAKIFLLECSLYALFVQHE